MGRRPDLADPWRAALDAAWASFVAGSLGVGAVVTDAAGRVVAAGRNRGAEDERVDGTLAGTPLAHAELEALAALPTAASRPRTLWTTLEPCPMCTGAVGLVPVEEVRFLAPGPVSTAGAVPQVGPVTGPEGVLGLLLPAHQWLRWGEPLPVRWRERCPRACALAEGLAAGDELVAAASGGRRLADVVDHLGDRLAAAAEDLAAWR